MPRRVTIPSPDQIGPDTPLRLDVAAAVAYPDGSMSGSGLRLEAGRGRLVIERTAGKDYTTLRHIEAMRGLCRRTEKARGCGCAEPAATMPAASPTPLPGSSRTADTSVALAAAQTIVQAQSEHWRTTSPKSTSRKRRPGNVVRLKFRSPTS
jgi:hypothetical protein